MLDVRCLYPKQMPETKQHTLQKRYTLQNTVTTNILLWSAAYKVTNNEKQQKDYETLIVKHL